MAHTVVRPAHLSRIVERIWDWDMPPTDFRLERVLPSAEASLIVNLADTGTRLYDEDRRRVDYGAMTLDGPRTTSSIIDTDEQVRVMGVVFNASTAALFFRERMDRLRDRAVNLDDLVAAADAERLRTRLLAAVDARARLRVLVAWLTEHLPAELPADAVALRSAIARLRADGRVEAIDAVARAVGMSRRRLAQRFGETVGMSPKRFLRLQRFQRVVDHAHSAARVDWAALASDGGYADQSHLCHEFRAFCGLTPTEYVARRGRWRDHVPLP